MWEERIDLRPWSGCRGQGRRFQGLFVGDNAIAEAVVLVVNVAVMTRSKEQQSQEPENA